MHISACDCVSSSTCVFLHSVDLLVTSATYLLSVNQLKADVVANVLLVLHFDIWWMLRSKDN